MGYTKAELEATKNALLASMQPITAAGKHRPAHQSILDALFDAETIGEILAVLDQQAAQQTMDEAVIIRNGQAFRAPVVINPLQRVSLDVSVSNPIMNMSGYPERIFVGSAPIAADKELSFSNDSAIIRATTLLEISGTRNITVPANVITDVSRWSWTKPATKFIWAAEQGKYRLVWTYDGANMFLDIYGLYSSTL